MVNEKITLIENLLDELNISNYDVYYRTSFFYINFDYDGIHHYIKVERNMNLQDLWLAIFQEAMTKERFIFFNRKKIKVKIANEKDLEFINLHYVKSHSAIAYGYASRLNNNYLKEYHGIYGDGYIIIHPSYNGSKFLFIEYYLEEVH